MRLRGTNRASSIQIRAERREVLDKFTVELSTKAGIPLYITDVINSIIDSLDRLDQDIILAQFHKNNEKALKKKLERSLSRQKAKPEK